jgi:hypothetical protein
MSDLRHGKEGVDGSSPSEGSAKAPQSGASSLALTCTIHSVRWVWSPLWSLQIEKCLRQGPKSGHIAEHEVASAAIPSRGTAALSRRRSRVRVPSLPSRKARQMGSFSVASCLCWHQSGVLETLMETLAPKRLVPAHGEHPRAAQAAGRSRPLASRRARSPRRSDDPRLPRSGVSRLGRCAGNRRPPAES